MHEPVGADVEPLKGCEAADFRRQALELVAFAVEKLEAAHVAYGCGKRLLTSKRC